MPQHQPEKHPRLLRIVTSLPVSGVSLHVILLTARLRQQGYDAQLIVGRTSANDSMMYIAQQYGVEPVFIPDMHRSINPLRNLRALFALRQLIRQTQPDVVHTHGTAAGFLGRLAAKWMRVPVIVHTLHVHPFRGYYTALSSLLFTLIERIGARLSDSIITLSEGLRRELTEHYHITRKGRMIVLPLGYDLDPLIRSKRHAGAFRQQWGIAADVPLVAKIGRMIPVKNHKLFLEAAALIHQQRPDIHFALIGDGELYDSLCAQAVALGIDQNVTFTGWQENVVPAYSDIDVLANSSWNEGTPVPIIEALAAGCRVVSTNVGGVSDLLDHGELGWLVPSGDAHALAQAILQSLDAPYNPDHARDVMHNRYGIDRLVNDLDSLYSGLLARKR